MATHALDADALRELLASSRQRGVYKVELENFLSSETAGAEVDLTDGVFAGKAAATVKQGFTTAIDKGNHENVRVISQGERVFLVNTSLV